MGLLAPSSQFPSLPGAPRGHIPSGQILWVPSCPGGPCSHLEALLATLVHFLLVLCAGHMTSQSQHPLPLEG